MFFNLKIAKTMKIYRYLFYITSAAIFSGCSDSFLDTKPIAQATEVSFYNSFDAVDKTCNAAYSVLNSFQVFDLYFPLTMGNYPTDDWECGGENTTDFPANQRQEDPGTILAMGDHLEHLYGYCYKGLRLCNTALDKFDLIEKQGLIKSEEESLVKQRRAEMKFLRAFYQFILAETYGATPVACGDNVTAPFTTDAEINQPRPALLKTVYEAIEQDLRAAIPDLPKKSELPGSEVGRATQGAAYGYLGKVLLFESSYAKNFKGDKRFETMKERWSEALEQFQNVIADNTSYSLLGLNGETFTSWWGGDEVDPGTVGAFRYIWSVAGDNSPESVWEIQSVQDNRGWVSTRGNYLTAYTSIRFLNATATTKEAATSWGWSWNAPSNYLLEAFQGNDSREEGLSDINKIGDETLDPRFRVTIGREGDFWLTAKSTWTSGNWVGFASNLPSKMIGRKFECAPSEYWTNKADWGEGPMNIRYMRMGDVYLMAAEAAFWANQKDKALEYVNAVRQRARNSGIDGKLGNVAVKNTGYPKALTSLSFMDIIHERRLELAGEGQRFFDIVRWGLGSTFFNDVEIKATGKKASFYKGKNEFFPITSNDVNASGGALTSTYTE